MKILIFSDSHGKYEPMKKALTDNYLVSAVLFLGDGIKDFEKLKGEYPGRTYAAVKGNTDIGLFTSGYQNESMLILDNKMILMMHGHTRNVKNGLEEAIVAARVREADILLYGHTHETNEQYIPPENGFKPLRVFCPGSIGGKGSEGKTYGILELRRDGMLFNIGRVRGN